MAGLLVLVVLLVVLVVLVLVATRRLAWRGAILLSS